MTLRGDALDLAETLLRMKILRKESQQNSSSIHDSDFIREKV